MYNKINLINNSKLVLNKEKFEEVIKHRFFYVPSSEIYGGISGLYDLGPIGALLESQIISIWREHFINYDSMLEVRSCQLTPYQTLEASGHVDRFSDIIICDSITGDSYRCDHLIKEYFEKMLSDMKISDVNTTGEYKFILNNIENYKLNDMIDIIKKYDIKSPKTNNSLCEPREFNLMFSTQIGPTGNFTGFLRPETAQGIFVNFKRLLEFNNNRLPFASAQVGFSFRNEISPRAGLIRCREFLMCEIEHFVHPENKNHAKFESVKDLELKLYSSYNQMNGKGEEIMRLGEAVEKKIIGNNVIGYYLGRIYLFLEKIGIDCNRIRFRQHLPNEMAHYASDCWDCEIESFYGWVECVGCADRSCYDLIQHSKKSGIKLVAQEILTEPINEEVYEIIFNKGIIGKEFRESCQDIIKYIQSMSIDEMKKFENELNINGNINIKINQLQFNITKNMIKSIKYLNKLIHVRDYYPHTIEPSFGIGRIMYSLLTHTIMERNDNQQRIWFNIPAIVAPIKCTILPLSNKKEFDIIIQELIQKCLYYSISYRVDDLSVSIGKRYSRNDELGIPFAITVDFDSINNRPTTVTLRERNSMEQIRLNIDIVGKVIKKLIYNKMTWEDATAKYGLFNGQTTIN